MLLQETDKMWVYQYQPLLNSMLQKALVELCTQSLPWEGRLEIDGIFCVSGREPSQQIVIKIHKALEKPEPKNLPGQKNVPDGSKKILIEAGKIISSRSGKAQHGGTKLSSPAKKGGLMPLNLSLPNLKSGASVTQNSTSQAVLSTTSTCNTLPRSLTVSNQSLRALLGSKGSHDDSASMTTILNQPEPMWLKKEEEGSETGSEPRNDGADGLHIKEEDESESSVDLDLDDLPATNLTCKLCAITFESFQALQSHTQEKHKRYACRQCCNTFSLRCNLRRHERLHAGVKPHACSYCKKLFSRSADLKAHLRKHAAEQAPDLIACSKCPKSFRNAVNLRLHMYKVHKEKHCVYACSICEKVFHDADQFQAHRLSHTQSLVEGGLNHTDPESACSTPILNGSQDSMDGSSENDTNDATFEHSLQQITSAVASHMGSPESGDLSPAPSLQGQGHAAEDMGLYFGSPLVIKEENDSNDAEFMKRSSRRKSKPSKLISSRLEREDESEILSAKRGSEDCGEEFGDSKRLRIDSGEYGTEIFPKLDKFPETFGMADQSLEDIMKQVNENLYQNKDVLIAEEKEKENEQRGKPKPKSRNSASKKTNVAKMPVSSSPSTRALDGNRAIEPKPPIVLFVSSNTGPVTNPKVAIPKMSLVKQQTSWSVSPKMRSKKDTTNSFSPIPHDMLMQASRESDTKEFTCGQWGCTFVCIGFHAFEDHTLSVHGRYPCKFCSQTFTGRNNRTRHIRYHMTGKQHQCSDCFKYFARPDSLKEHRFIHTKSYRDSNCCNCKIYFEKKATLLSHMKKCFSDEQLVTDKLSPEDIERESSLKKDGHKDTSMSKDLNASKDLNLSTDPNVSKNFSLPKDLNLSQDSSLTTELDVKKVVKEDDVPSTSGNPLVPSDVGVMKAEYLQKEKQKILDVKNYLDTQMGLEDGGGEENGPPADEDDVTVIDLDGSGRGKPQAVSLEEDESTAQGPQPPAVAPAGFASTLISKIAVALSNSAAQAVSANSQQDEDSKHSPEDSQTDNSIQGGEDQPPDPSS